MRYKRGAPYMQVYYQKKWYMKEHGLSGFEAALKDEIAAFVKHYRYKPVEIIINKDDLQDFGLEEIPEVSVPVKISACQPSHFMLKLKFREKVIYSKERIPCLTT